MRILFVCTANRERSPTAEMVFRDVPGWEVKSAGTNPDATERVTQGLIDWADRIVVMESRHLERLVEVDRQSFRKTLVLGIEDIYYRCSPLLVGLLINRIGALFPLDEWVREKFCCQAP
jgi:predicted protein tyrosine phosphatase